MKNLFLNQRMLPRNNLLQQNDREREIDRYTCLTCNIRHDILSMKASQNLRKFPKLIRKKCPALVCFFIFTNIIQFKYLHEKVCIKNSKMRTDFILNPTYISPSVVFFSLASAVLISFGEHIFEELKYLNSLRRQSPED